MKTLRLEIELQYDGSALDDDSESEKWFYEEILHGGHLVLFDTGELSDELGKIRVLSIGEGAEALSQDKGTATKEEL